MNDAVQYEPPVAVSGVYFLMCGEEVVYVGQSEDVATRLNAHFRDRDKAFDRAFYLPVPIADLSSVEAEHVRRWAPKYNARPGGECDSKGRYLAIRRDVETAVGFLAHTDEDGISARDLHRRVVLRTNTGTAKAVFHRAMDADSRVRYFPAEGVYRLVLTPCTVV